MDIRSRSQWPSGLGRGSAADRLLGFRVRIPPVVWMSPECCVLSHRGFCDRPIPRPEESNGLWCVIVCHLDTSRMRRSWLALGCCTRGGGCIYVCVYLIQENHWTENLLSLFNMYKCGISDKFNRKLYTFFKQSVLLVFVWFSQETVLINRYSLPFPCGEG
jgi:hypothetical protein